MANLLPSVFNKETGKWETIIARPVAQEVFKIMKEDYLRSKGEIGYIFVSHDEGDMPVNLVLFYDTSKTGTEIVDNTERVKKNIKFNLDQYLLTKNNNAKQFRISEFRQRIEDLHLVDIDSEFYVEVIDTEGQKHVIPSTKSLTNNFEITNALLEAGNEIKVKYFYNGNPIDDFMLDKKVTEENRDRYPSEVE